MRIPPECRGRGNDLFEQEVAVSDGEDNGDVGHGECWSCARVAQRISHAELAPVACHT